MAITRTAKGTNTSKSSGTTLTIASVSMTTGHLLVVALAYDDQTLDSVTWGSESLTLGDTVLGAGVRTRLAYGTIVSGGTQTITATWASAITAKAMAATSFSCDVGGATPQVDTNATNTGNGTSASTPAVAAIKGGTNSILFGVVGTEGPSGDTAGTWSTPSTGGQRAGTTGNPAASNVTVSDAYQLAPTSASTPSLSKTGMTSRDWGAAIRAFYWASVVSTSFTANAVIKKGQTPSFSSDAVIKREQSATLTANAVLSVTQSSSFTADAVISAGGVDIVRRQFAVNDNGASATTTVSVTISTPTAGDRMVLAVGWRNNATTDATPPGSGGDWTQLERETTTSGAPDLQYQAWERIADGSEGTTLTVTIPSSLAVIGFVEFYSNSGNPLTLDVSEIQASTSSGLNNPSIATGTRATGSEYVGGFLTHNNSSTTATENGDLDEIGRDATTNGTAANNVRITADELITAGDSASKTNSYSLDATVGTIIHVFAYKVDSTVSTSFTADAVISSGAQADLLADAVMQVRNGFYDPFSRTVTDSWDGSEAGPYILDGPNAQFDIDGSFGTIRMPSAGDGRGAAMQGVRRSSSVFRFQFKLDKQPATDRSVVFGVVKYADSDNKYQLEVEVHEDATIWLEYGKHVGGVYSAIGSAVQITRETFVADQLFNVEAVAVGINPTLLFGKVWRDGTTKPATWDLETSDSSMDLDAGIEVRSRLTPGVTNAPLVASFDNFDSGIPLFADAVLKREQSASITGNAVIFKTQSASFTADAYITTGQVTVDTSFTADAILLTTQSASITGNAVIKATISASLTANAVVFKTQSASLTGDAVVLRTQTASLTASAVIAKTVSTSLTADAVIKREQTASFTADAVIFATISRSLTVDAIIKREQTASFTANAVLLKTQAVSLTTDAVIVTTISRSLAADAVIYREQTASLTADAVLLATQSASFTADAVIVTGQVTVETSFAADSIIKREQSASITADAVLKREQTAALTADAVIYREQAASFTGDAVIKREQTASLTADAVLLKTQAASFTADAVIVVTVSRSLTADAVIYREQAAILTGDAVILREQTASFTGDAVLLRTQTASLTADAVVFATISATFTADAVIMPVFTADAVILRTQTASMTADAVIMPVFTADAVIKAEQAASLTADAWIQGAGTAGFTADAVIRVEQTATFTGDAILYREQTASVTGDAVIFATISASFTADAVIALAASQGFTADAVILREQSASFTADAEIRYVGVPVWTTPGNHVSVNTTTPTFNFRMPDAFGSMHFWIELDTVDTFDSPDYQYHKSHSDLAGWEFFDGVDWQPVPQSGVDNIYAGREARYTLQTPITNGVWYRRVRAGVI